MDSRIGKITDAKLPLQVVDTATLEYLKARNPIYVSPRQLKSSRGVLISENYSKCQGINFLDGKCEVGALAHNFASHDPYSFLTGAWSSSDENIEDPRKIFNDMSRVVAVHTYHKDWYEWPETWIEGALAKVGVKSVIHIPLKSKNEGRTQWRHVAQVVKDSSVLIFPTDFNYGIMYVNERE